MKPQPGYIPSAHPAPAALEASIEGALRAGEIDHQTANAMFAVVRPHCAAHDRPALILRDGAACCEACIRSPEAR